MNTNEQLRDKWNDYFANDKDMLLVKSQGYDVERIIKIRDEIADWWLSKLSQASKEAVEGIEMKYEEIFAWLLGMGRDFPDLSKKPHYSFRTELRKKLDALHPHSKDEITNKEK